MGDFGISSVGQAKRPVEILEPVLGKLVRKIREEMEPLVCGPCGSWELRGRKPPLQPCLRRLLNQREPIRLGWGEPAGSPG